MVTENPYVGKKFSDLYFGLLDSGVTFPDTNRFLDIFHVPPTADHQEKEASPEMDSSDELYTKLSIKIHNLENIRNRITELIGNDVNIRELALAFEMYVTARRSLNHDPLALKLAKDQNIVCRDLKEKGKREINVASSLAKAWGGYLNDHNFKVFQLICCEVLKSELGVSIEISHNSSLQNNSKINQDIEDIEKSNSIKESLPLSRDNAPQVRSSSNIAETEKIPKLSQDDHPFQKEEHLATKGFIAPSNPFESFGAPSPLVSGLRFGKPQSTDIQTSNHRLVESTSNFELDDNCIGEKNENHIDVQSTDFQTFNPDDPQMVSLESFRQLDRSVRDKMDTWESERIKRENEIKATIGKIELEKKRQTRLKTEQYLQQIQNVKPVPLENNVSHLKIIEKRDSEPEKRSNNEQPKVPQFPPLELIPSIEDPGRLTSLLSQAWLSSIELDQELEGMAATKRQLLQMLEHKRAVADRLRRDTSMIKNATQGSEEDLRTLKMLRHAEHIKRNTLRAEQQKLELLQEEIDRYKFDRSRLNDSNFSGNDISVISKRYSPRISRNPSPPALVKTSGNQFLQDFNRELASIISASSFDRSTLF